MRKTTPEEKYVNKMKSQGLNKICVWCAICDNDKVKNTARLSRNRVFRVK